MMKACVVYDSFFGNTAKMAEIIGANLIERYEVQIISVNQLKPVVLKDLQLLVVGSPTRGFEPTKPIKNVLQNIQAVDFPHLQIVCFDTRMDIKKINNKILNFFVKFRGYALDSMEKIVKHNGFSIIHPGMGFFVDESEGPLGEGEEKKAGQWAHKIMRIAIKVK
ncbi:MAG: nitric oxide synthase [Anaerolineaceae bacterium]|nr:nitric oxide synthase [Anaerolineaceae bacterium]